MKAEVAGGTADQRLLDTLATLLRQGALPGELDDYSAEETREAAAFIAACAGKRQPGTALVRVESTGSALGHRPMRIGIVNDAMPFLVDSVAQAVAGRGLIIHRLFHPVVCTTRDDDGCLQEIEPLCEDRSRRESIIYIEVDRADAKGRQELAAELQQVLADVRAAVTDWRAMQANMHAQADTVRDPEGQALLHWLADGAMTLLGYEIERPGQQPSGGLGIMGKSDQPTDEGGSEGAIAYFEKGGQEPLIAKADLRSNVHRRVPLDLIVVPLRECGKIAGIGVHAGLWTSQALSAPIEEVPVLRRQLAALEKDFGFDPSGHGGKALRHALAALPRDLMVNLAPEDVKALVSTSISLADRPRPALMLVRSILRGHMFAFVWLPRDELTTRRRVQIGEMIAQASAGQITNWSVDLGDGDLAQLRFTLNVDAKRATPDVPALDRKLDDMVRGWVPSVEEALAKIVSGTRATKLALTYAPCFPQAYRSRYPAEDAALDIVHLDALTDDQKRGVRLYRLDIDPECQLRLKIYRKNDLVPLSDVVPVLENFGFHVLKETPTRLEDHSQGHIHEFAVITSDRSPSGPAIARAEVVESVIEAVLEGRSENDAFNQLLVSVGLSPEG